MGALLGILMSFLADIFTKSFMHAAYKIAITLAFIALFVAAIYAYVSGFSTIIEALGQTMPEIVTGVWGWVMPSNTNSCIFFLFSSVLLRFVTTQFLKVLQFKFKAAISN
jgi:asparagine N-glycosylation enzyme membrane subunit Stt3